MWTCLTILARGIPNGDFVLCEQGIQQDGIVGVILCVSLAAS
jgi:hypothetical protein